MAACASIWGFEDGSLVTETGDATADGPPDAILVGYATSGDHARDARDHTDSASDAKAATEASAEYAHDAGDPSTVTTADPTEAIFVAGTGNDGPSCGSPSAPCLHIQTGLDRASAGSLAVVNVQQ